MKKPVPPYEPQNINTKVNKRSEIFSYNYFTALF